MFDLQPGLNDGFSRAARSKGVRGFEGSKPEFYVASGSGKKSQVVRWGS